MHIIKLFQLFISHLLIGYTRKRAEMQGAMRFRQLQLHRWNSKSGTSHIFKRNFILYLILVCEILLVACIKAYPQTI